MKHLGTKTFETKRLICRRFVFEDCQDMLRNWVSDPRIQFEYGEPIYTISQVKELLTKYTESYQHPDYYRWAIIVKKHRADCFL